MKNKHIICIYHSRDLDGWMSAAIVKYWFKENNKSYAISDLNDIQEYEGTKSIGQPYLDMLGWDYGDVIPDLSEYDKVIMCDISFPPEKMEELMYKLTWIDHHISAIKANSKLIDLVQCEGSKGSLKLNPKYAACELTWEYFFPEEGMHDIVEMLGLYDSFRHKGTSQEKEVLEFQYGARQALTNYQECYQVLSMPFEHQNTFVWDTMEKGEAIYKYLCTEAKQIYSKAFPIKFYHKTEAGYGPTNFLCVNHERFNPINFGIDYHKEGYGGFACFWFKNDEWNFSLYNDDGLIDCSLIAKEYGGGGHKGASGFTIGNINDIIR